MPAIRDGSLGSRLAGGLGGVLSRVARQLQTGRLALVAALPALALAGPARALTPTEVTIEARFLEVERDLLADFGIFTAPFFSPPAINKSGNLVGRVTDTGPSGSTVLYSYNATTEEFAVIESLGEDPLGVNVTDLSSDPVINDRDTVAWIRDTTLPSGAFEFQLVSCTSCFDDPSDPSGRSIVTKEGDPLGGDGAPTVGFLRQIAIEPAIDPDTGGLMESILVNLGTIDRELAIFSDEDADGAFEGEVVVPASDLDHRFIDLASEGFKDGHATFLNTDGSGRHVILDKNAELSAVASAGVINPGIDPDSPVLRFAPPVLNCTGDTCSTLGRATLFDGDEVLFEHVGDDTRPLLRTGMVTEILNGPSLVFDRFDTIAPAGEGFFAFEGFGADLDGEFVGGVFLRDPLGNLFNVVTIGDEVDGETVISFDLGASGAKVQESIVLIDVAAVHRDVLGTARGDPLAFFFGFGADTALPVAEADGPYTFDATRLSIALDGSESFDPDNGLPGEPGAGIVEYAWSNDAGFAAGTGFAVMPIEESGLRDTLDVATVRLDVLDDESERDPDGDTATLRYDNRAPRILSVFARAPTVGTTLLDVHGEDPDGVVNALIPGFESVSVTIDAPPLGLIVEPVPFHDDTRFSLEGALLLTRELSEPVEFAVRDFASDVDRVVLSPDLLSAVPIGATSVAFFETGSPVALSQSVDTPSDPFLLQFDFLFGTETGVLDVLLGHESLTEDLALISIDAMDFPDPFLTRAFIPIDHAEALGLTDAMLSFVFDGPAGSRMLLDNVVWPGGLVNHDFETGDLTGWTLATTGDATGGVTELVPDVPGSVPEPASVALAALGLAGLGFARRRRFRD